LPLSFGASFCKGGGAVLLIMGLIIAVVVFFLMPCGARCHHCGQRSTLFARAMAFEKDFCDDCLYTVNREIREKRSE
jgi:hypothetical protein